MQAAVDAALASALGAAAAGVHAQLTHAGERHTHASGSWAYDPKTGRAAYKHTPGQCQHSYALLLLPAAEGGAGVSDAAHKAAATRALHAIAALPGVGAVRSRAACATDADVAALLTKHGLAGCLAATLLHCHKHTSCVLRISHLPSDERARTKLLASLAADAVAPPVLRGAGAGGEGEPRSARVTYASSAAARAAAAALNLRADGVRAKLLVWQRRPPAAADAKGWRAKLLLHAPPAAGGAAVADEDEDAAEEGDEQEGEQEGGGRRGVARLHAALESALTHFLWDVSGAHGVTEVDASAVVLVDVDDAVEVAQPDARRAHAATPPVHAGTLDLRFVPAPEALPDDEQLAGAPARRPGAAAALQPPAAQHATLAAAAGACAELVVAHRKRCAREKQWVPYHAAVQACADVGRWLATDTKTRHWVTLHVADAAQSPADAARSAPVAVGAQFGASRSCVWAALHACAAVPGRAGVLYAPLRLTGLRAATGELTLRASVALDVGAACALRRGSQAEHLTVVLRHLAAARAAHGALAPPPGVSAQPKAPPPAAAAGFCGVVGCAAHRASIGAAVETAAADVFSVARLYADSANAQSTPAAAAAAAAAHVAPPGLAAQLQGFQAATLAWALAREQPPARLDLHPLIRGIGLADSRVLYWDDGVTGAAADAAAPRFGLHPTVAAPLDVRGGIIAEEMVRDEAARARVCLSRRSCWR